MLTNEELKKKIIETLEKGGRNFLKSKETKVSIYEYYADALIAAGIGDVKDLQAQVDTLEITNIALQAGYDDAENDRLYWVGKYKEAEHHAEVAEKALDLCETAYILSLNHRATEGISGQAIASDLGVHKFFMEQAEKELMEERKKMNKAEKSLRWVVNQIPDFKPTTNEEKMLVAIKLYSDAGAEEIKRLEVENAELRTRLDNAVELKYDVGDTVYLIQRTPDYPNGTILETTVRDVEVRKNKNGTFLNYYTELDNTYFSISEAEINVFAFTDKAAAETRLAELKGKMIPFEKELELIHNKEITSVD